METQATQTQNAFTPATVETSLFDPINTGRATRKPADGLDPLATRYGLVPIRAVTGLNSNAFRRWELPANRFIPFRPFEYPLTNAGGHLVLHTRSALEQLLDFYDLTAAKFGTDFPELAALEDEEAAVRVFNALTNHRPCVKYAYELKNECVTCWLDYLRGDAVKTLAAEFENEPHLRDAAVKTHDRLVQALAKARHSAELSLNEALKMIDDPKSGKDGLADIDYIYIWHLHQDQPKYRTSTDASSELAKAIAEALRTQNAPAPAVGLSAEDVKRMIEEAAAAQTSALEAANAEIAALKQQLAAAEKQPKKGK